MTRIVQIAPVIGPGTGVAGVAHHLELEFLASGATVERFTALEAGRRHRRTPRSAIGMRLRHAADVAWFSTVGTARARRFLAQRPDAVSICHNDVMAGDVYVNHGLLVAAMRTRGHYVLRMLRNPLHLFTAVRDRIRYRGHTHRAIVALTDQEAQLLVDTYGRMDLPIRVIANGVDLDRFRPASEAERARARASIGLSGDSLVAVFIGHEFERKGLPIVVDALRQAPGVSLLVVGGTPDQIRHSRGQSERLGVADRVHYLGPQPDPVPFLQAADVFVLPSAYESYGLVIMEALASGVPVVSTSVGVAPEVIDDGMNGFIVPQDAAVVAQRLRELSGQDLSAWRQRARERAAGHSWRAAADRYLALVDELQAVKKEER